MCAAALAVMAALIGQMATARVASAQHREERILYNSSVVLDEFMSLRLRGIPRAMLADAKGVVIIPSMVKAGLVIGGRHGKGVLVMRDEAGHWRVPVFVTVTGGNIGYQIGVQATDLILIFKTHQSIEGILDGKLTLGVDVAAAAGPVGREAAAATDGQLRAEIYSYSRSRGLFAGVSIDGSVLQVADDLNTAYYGVREGRLGDEDLAVQLVTKVATYSVDRRDRFESQTYGQPAAEELPTPAGEATPEQLWDPRPTPAGEPSLAPPLNSDPRNADPRSAEVGSVDEGDVLRGRLSQSHGTMSRLLDRSWNAYLALPAEILEANGRPSPDALRATVARYDSVAAGPQYHVLNSRQEFRATHTLLKQYEQAMSENSTALRLPTPPADGEPRLIAPPRR
jgi:lipid-binding SYLF domain-containing protein